MNLWADFLTNDQRMIHKWKHYFPAYERHFQRFVYRPVVFWEIGCGKGGSLQMWKRYFGPHAQIIGLDIRAQCAPFEEDQIAIRIGDQSNADFLDSVLAEFGTPDIVLDDGSHVMEHVVATFRHLYPKLDRNGVYMVEDMHTAYWEKYGGGLRRAGTFIELSKHLIDELNGRHARIETAFTKSTLSIHFYDSIVVFERGLHGGRKALRIPDPGSTR
jgi:hypothetical protein